MSITPGFILINKPSGPTSHDIVDALRKITGEKTIGHAGTLDPFATGLLILGIGREATRRMLALAHLDKWYEATIKLGVETDTYDRTGTIVHVTCNIQHVTQKNKLELHVTSYMLQETLKSFLGPQKQIPPMFSAKKINGQKLYELARQGKEIERPSAQVSIYRIDLIDPPPQSSPFAEEGGNPPQAIQTMQVGGSRQRRDFSPLPSRGETKRGDDALHASCPMLKLLIRCSSGTYIRSIAHDLGQKLGSGAHLQELKRLAIGPFNLNKALSIEQLAHDSWQKKIIPVSEILKTLEQYKQNPISPTVIPHQSLPRTRCGDAGSTLKNNYVDSRLRGNDDRDCLPIKKILAFGTFDPLHEGHLYYLTETKKYGNHLTVVVTRDQHIKHFKNREPRQNEQKRLQTIQALPCVNEARLSDKKLDWACLKEVRPDLIALGHDQFAVKEALKDSGIPIIILKEYNKPSICLQN